MKRVLLALGEENFSALFRKEFDMYEHPTIAFDVLSDEVLSRNFLEPLTKMYSPDYVVIHDTFLSTTASTVTERDAEIIKILKSIRLQSDARIVYICQRDNSDHFLSQLVALGIYDIFNEQAINTVKFMEQVTESAKLSNVLNWTNGLSDVQPFELQITEQGQNVTAQEDIQPIDKPKKSLLSQIKKFSPFKISNTETSSAAGSNSPEANEEDRDTEPAQQADEPKANSTANEHAEDVKIVPGPNETVTDIQINEDEPRIAHSISVEDLFTETVKPMPVLPKSVPPTVEKEKTSPASAIEETTVFPIMSHELEQDFLISKVDKGDVFDDFTARMEAKNSPIHNTKESAPTEEIILATETNPPPSKQIEDHIATIADVTASQWQHFLNSYEPVSGQFATIYAIGHLARDYSTTQFAINCAVLLREQYTKVAIVELNQNLNLEYVQAFATGSQPFDNNENYFETHGITHFKFKVGLPLKEILQRFDAVVLDLGMISNLHPYKSYFERGNYRLLLTPTYQWSWHLVDTFIHYDPHALSDYQFVMFNAAKHNVMNFKRIYGNRVQLHALESINRLYDLSDDDKQAIRPLIGLKKGSRLKKGIL